MFQPEPTPFSSFYPAYLPEAVDDDGVRGDFSSYSSYQQAPFALVGPGPGAPGVSAGGPGPGRGPAAGGHDASGGAAGVGSTAPLPVFPFHGALPGAPNLLNTSNQQPQSQHPFSPIHRVARNIKMEQNQGMQDDLAAQEAAARTWEPELEGPRVGDKTPIDAIAAEYAKADPVYVAKTIALPQAYSHYRPVKGDGNCGWRAIGFSYFELLIQQGSKEMVEGERLRLTQLNDYLFNSGGYDPDMFMDFVEETFQLLQEISGSIHDPEVAMALLSTKFNDEQSSMGVLYHLRLLAGAWLKGHRDQYEAWCENNPDGYCQSTIEPPQREIEELGIVLLVEVLLKPVGYTLEIAYLDRSAGTEVNTHRFPDSGSSSLGPFIYLLYRPGHYDILYKPSPFLHPMEVQVNRMAFEPATFASAPSCPDTYDMNPLAMLPGYGAVGPLSPMRALGGSSLDFSPSPQSTWFSSPYADSSPTPPSQAQPARQTPLPTQPLPSASSLPPANPHEIRFSEYQYKEGMDANSWPDQTFQTNMFKNSHFNTAHYNNPNFQPEEYNPGTDDIPERCERSGRRRHHGKKHHSSSEDSTGQADSKREK